MGRIHRRGAEGGSVPTTVTAYKAIRRTPEWTLPPIIVITKPRGRVGVPPIAEKRPSKTFVNGLERSLKGFDPSEKGD